MGAKKDKLPKGVGRVPEWWMTVAPHDVLIVEDDIARKHAQLEEEKKFARLAALQDLLDKYGGEGFPDWNPSKDGPRTKEEENEWVSKGYKRNATNEWINSEGKPLEGKAFQGTVPPGYVPGDFIKDDGTGGAELDQGTLNSNKYERDKSAAWDKPDWMKVKLRSTGTGGAVGHSETVEQPITKSDGTVISRAQATPEQPAPEIVAPVVTEEVTDPHGRDVGTIKSAAKIKPRATGELQAILNRRKQASD
jgi:hypothetical protein